MSSRAKNKRQSMRFAEGGSTRMLLKQAANPQKPGGTAHDVKGGAPGAKRAVGGSPRPVGGAVERARPGRTGPRSDDG